MSNVFVQRPVRLIALLEAIKTTAHRRHDECLDVGWIDARQLTVPIRVGTDVFRPSSVYKREAGRISIGDGGVLVQCVA